MKLRCAILDDYQHAALRAADWSPITDRVELVTFHQPFPSQDELVSALHGCQIAVIMRERTPFPASVFRRLPELRLLVTTGMRNASVDLQAAGEGGVVVCGTASSSAAPAELTWALLLALARQLPREDQAFHTGGPWQSTVGADLEGRRLGLLGLGKIGGRVAKVGQAFGMEVAAWSQHLTPKRAAAAGVTWSASKEELLETSDFVSIHLVLSDRTRGLLGAAELRRMRPTAYLINTSRAPIVEENALVEALRSGWIAGAGLDVFEQEPLPVDHPLRGLPNVLGTPHLGYVTHGNYATYYREAVEDIAAYLDGAPIRTLA